MTTLSKVLKYDKANDERYFAEKITLFSIFSISLYFQKINGKHLSLGMGLGPFEFEISFRFWGIFEK